MSDLNILEADRMEITVLMDNYTDMLLTERTDVYRRPQIPLPNILLAEHGLSCLTTLNPVCGTGTLQEHFSVLAL